VEANSTGGQGTRRAVAPSYDDDECTNLNRMNKNNPINSLCH
jgi:hypothetical protein